MKKKKSNIRSSSPRWRQWILYPLLVAGLAAAGYFVGRPAYRHFRNQRLDAHLASAQEAIQRQDWGTARNLARSVLISRRGDFEAFRVWFRALTAMGEPRAYLAAIELFAHPQSSPEDKLNAFRELCLQAPQAVALGAYASLKPEVREQTEFRAALAPLLLLRGEIRPSEAMLRQAPDREAHPAATLELLRLLCASPSLERVTEARQLFADLAEKDPAKALQALDVLALVPGGLAPGEPLPADLAAWVAAQPSAQPLHHLYALHPALAAAKDDPQAADALFQKAIDRFLASEPGVLGTWLTLHGRQQQVVPLLEPAAANHPGAYIARLHAMMKLEMNVEIAAALENPPPSADMVELELVRAALAHRRGDEGVEKIAWNRALQEAAFDQTKNRFFEIARYAGVLQAAETADNATVAAIRIGWGRIPLYQDLYPTFARLAGQNRTEDLLAVYRTLLRFEPGNPELRNNYLYLGLLHQVLTPADALRQLEALHQSQPEALQFQSALAFAALMDHQPARTLEILPALEADPRFPKNLLQAMRGAALLAQAGDDSAREQGRRLLAGIDWTKLLTREAIALHEFLVQLNVENIPLPQISALDPATGNPEDTPAWRRAVEALEAQRSSDVLPPLPMPKLPEYDLPAAPAPAR